jgi:hypothetical protein
MAAASEQESRLDELLVEWYYDPLAFVRGAYPWGESGGSLSLEAGPDAWQVEFLTKLGLRVRRNAFNGQDPVAPIRMAVSSGHGVGKSVLVAWLVDWIMSTRPHAQGVVTANTSIQLETKTWPAITRWTKLCLTAHRFEINTARMYEKGHKESWFVTPQTCREENSESFAGQHARDSTSFYIFDEDSAVPDQIHTVAEGGLTDGEPMIFLCGNPTRLTGQFHRAVFGNERGKWESVVVDSRTSRFTNKETIAEWAAQYGEDSDFFRVRVRGLPPRASDAQFIDQERVLQAQSRKVYVMPDEPLVVGCDLAWGGGDDNVIRFRRGNDARSIPPIRVKGEFTRDPAVLTTRLAEVLTTLYEGRKVHTLFLDSAGIAGPIGQRLRMLGHRNVQEVNFGADSPDAQCRFMRDYMWQKMKEWLAAGAIDGSAELESDLVGPGVRSDQQQRVWLEDKRSMRNRGLDSPDDADALALTFASPVRATSTVKAPSMVRRIGTWMGT